jgi:hypothetical protein
MWKKIVSIFLILGWISLSGFDVVEDLGELSNETAVSTSAPEGSPVPNKRGVLVHLANNMVELAYRTHQVEVTLRRFFPHILSFASVPDSRRHSPLHKRFRVLLI